VSTALTKDKHGYQGGGKTLGKAGLGNTGRNLLERWCYPRKKLPELILHLGKKNLIYWGDKTSVHERRKGENH